MSWITNVALFYSVGEELIDSDNEEGFQDIGTSPCLLNINSWLQQHGWVELVEMTHGVGDIERHGFEAHIWGAALNYLDIKAFLSCIKRQKWYEPENVQVMIKDQEEVKFTLYHLNNEE